MIAFNSLGIQLNSSNGPESVKQNTIIGNITGGIVYDYPTSGGLTLVQNLISGNRGIGVYWNNVVGPMNLISNTIADNALSCCDGGDASEVVMYPVNASVTLHNNLIVSNGVWPAFDCTYSASPAAFTSNDVFASNTPAYSAECPSETGSSANISADPLFVDLLGGNFQIQSGSPAIKAGDNSVPGEPATDFVGNPRTISGVIDIGADEYSSKPTLTLSRYAAQFAGQVVGTTSASQSVTLTNQGKSALTLSLIATGGSFSQTNNCGTALAAGASCRITVSFFPQSSGTLNSALGIFTSATLNPLAVSLTGTGLAPQVSLNPFYLDFRGQIVGTTGTKTATLSNTGTAALLIRSIKIAGTSDFTESNNCPLPPKTIAPGASCVLTVNYSPTIVTYSDSATITVSDNAGAAQTLSVSGSSYSAGDPLMSPSTLNFPPTLIGQSSASQNITLTNIGSGTLGGISFNAYGDFAFASKCPATLAPAASCTISVTYMPRDHGAATGFVGVFNDSPYGASVTLTGTGVAPAPTLSSLSVTGAPVGSSGYQVTATGTGFAGDSQIMWNGIALPCCSYTGGTSLISFTIPAGTLDATGIYQISVYTPLPGGGTSASLPFTVYTPINYAEESTTYTYDSITGANLGLYYNGQAQITSPFPVQFGGGSFTTLTIGAGGTISFTGSTGSFNTAIPYSSLSTIVAPFWASLYPFGSSTGTNNNVFWEVTGTAPNRALIVEWRNVGYCCESSNTIRFEVIFHEGSGNILFNYDNTVFGGSYSADNNGATATDGIQVTSNLGTQFSYDQPLILSKTSQLWYPSSPTPSVSVHTLAFGYHQLDMPSTPQKVTLTNGSIATLNISSIATSDPDFAATSNCGTTLASGKSCVITVIFTPTQPSAETATLTITDNAANSPQTISLTGIGSITSIVVYPILLNFGSDAVGSTATAPVTLANASNKRITIQSITTSPAVYAESNNCGTSLAPGLSCTINVSFTPALAGSVQGTLSMGLENVPAKVEANLTGSGK